MRLRQVGFILVPILLGLILIGAIMGAIAIMSREEAGGNDRLKLTTEVIYMLNQASILRDSVLRARTDGLPMSSLDEGQGGSMSALLINGYIKNELPRPPAGVLATSAAYTVVANRYAVKQFDGSDLDTPLAEDVLMLQDISENACRQINHKLHGESILSPSIGGALSVDALTPAPLATGKDASEGCITKSAASYSYYKVLVQH